MAGVQRALQRLRPRSNRSAGASIRSGAHRISRTERVADRVIALVAPRLDRLVDRVGGRERVLPIAIAILVLIASVSSAAVYGTAKGATGSTSREGAAPRISIGGIDTVTDPVYLPDQAGPATGIGQTVDGGIIDLGQYLPDGTLLKPIAVDTTVSDASAKLVTYTVRSGDTLTGIAKKFGLSMMTLWWANHLAAKDVLHIGEKLAIPPVDGLVIVVKAGDTLDSLAALTGMSADDIVTYNNLADRTLVLGQVLIIPNVLGKPIAVVAPTRRVASSGGSSGAGSGASHYRPPVSYSGGAFTWPVPGGYISQYYHYGHLAIDIAAPEGSRVLAAAAGTVIWAGWKDNGGGYQVWIAHGSGLFTTYNHMSAVLVGIGQHVGRGQQVGRVGMTGSATGPHCHFEVWHGMVWGDGVRVNPLPYF